MFFKQGTLHYHFSLSLSSYVADTSTNFIFYFLFLLCFCLFVQISGASLNFYSNSSLKSLLLLSYVLISKKSFLSSEYSFSYDFFFLGKQYLFFHSLEHVIEGSFLLSFFLLLCLCSVFYMRGNSRCI